MRVPLSWLRDFAPFEDDAAALASTLDDLGLVVEEIERVGEGLADVVVARVVEVAPIAGADRIRRVVVDDGADRVDVVCGAWNFAEGDLVALAPAGAVLPGGFEIARRKMKGVVSNGMLCSGSELRLSDDAEGILVLQRAGEEPARRAPAVGSKLLTALGIEPDVVFDIAVEANRPDAYSVAGIARDLAARLGLAYAPPEFPAIAGHGPAVEEWASVVVVDGDLCPRFTARVLTGVVVAPSPQWVARRLSLAGMRPINNVVDASNYVMLEMGQPTHPYDLDRVTGAGLRVRAGRPGERVVTLDGVERTMGEPSVGPGDDRRDCLICDAEDVPIGIGGVMGGSSTEISPVTSRVLLEAAYFAPMAIARTSKRLGLRTEASARFARGADPEGIDQATLRVCQILGAGAADGTTDGATDGSAVLAPGSLDVRHAPPGARVLEVRTSRVNAVIGLAPDAQLGDDDVARYLEPIGFSCARRGPGVLDVTVPTFRPDTEREIDVIEEVARHYGYSRVARRRPCSPYVGGLSDYQLRRRLVRDTMAGLGADEAWTSSMLSPADHRRVHLEREVVVSNPLSPEESVLRRHLLPGLLRALAFNVDRRQGDVRLFEVGHVFPPPPAARVAAALAGGRDTVVDERELLGLLLAAPGDDARSAVEAWAVLTDALGVEGLELASEPPGADTDATVGEAEGATADAAVLNVGALHPSRRAVVSFGGSNVGVVGEVDPEVLFAFGLDPLTRVGWLEVDLGVLLEDVPRRTSTMVAVSRFPSSDVDLAFGVDERVPASVVERTVRRAAGPLLESSRLFDVYRGPGVAAGTRGLAFRLRFRAPDRTLTDAEVGDLRARTIAAVEREHDARLR